MVKQRISFPYKFDSLVQILRESTWIWSPNLLFVRQMLEHDNAEFLKIINFVRIVAQREIFSNKFNKESYIITNRS